MNSENIGRSKMGSRQELLRSIDQIFLESNHEYRIGYAASNPLQRALDLQDLLDVVDLVPFALQAVAGTVSIVKTVIDNFIDLINALRISEHYFELIGGAEGTVAWTFGDITKPQLSDARKEYLKPHYAGPKLDLEWQQIKVAHDQAVHKMWQKLDSACSAWINNQWSHTQRLGRGAAGAHMRVSRGPLMPAPLPPTPQFSAKPKHPKQIFRFILIGAVNNDRAALKKRLLSAAARGMSAQDRMQFEIISGLKFM